MITTLLFPYVIDQVLREKFLEMLLLDRIDDALAILQKHMSKIPVDPALIHELTALLLCPDKKSLKHMAQWTGGVSSSSIVKSTKKASAVTTTVKSNNTEVLMKLTHLLQLGTVRHGTSCIDYCYYLERTSRNTTVYIASVSTQIHTAYLIL
jgi:hypothetical protein